MKKHTFYLYTAILGKEKETIKKKGLKPQEGETYIHLSGTKEEAMDALRAEYDFNTIVSNDVFIVKVAVDMESLIIQPTDYCGIIFDYFYFIKPEDLEILDV